MRQPNSRDQAIIMSKDGQFWAFGHWSAEYPDAQLYPTNEAIEKALWLRSQVAVQVITRYGTPQQRVVFDSDAHFAQQFNPRGVSAESALKSAGLDLER
jgi:hypothetical protein